MYVTKGAIAWCLFLFCTVISIGCSDPPEEVSPVVIIQTPILSIDNEEFAQELDLKRVAYPYDIDKDPDAYNKMVMNLVEMLSEELVLLSAAFDNGIRVLEAELSEAETAFKKEYPEDSFEQMLLTSAIPYSLWKKRFHRNLLIEKLIDQELSSKIDISPEEIVAFYNALKASKKDQGTQASEQISDAQENNNFEQALISRLRMHKTQEQYDQWIQGLWSKYPVQVNKEHLKLFLIALEQTKGNKNEK